MRNNWREEPILRFELEKIGGNMPQGPEEEKLGTGTVYAEHLIFAEHDLEGHWLDALFWYKQAALQGEPLAIRMLKCVEDFKSVRRKALRGDKDAQFRLAVYYFDGYGTSIDLNAGSHWLRMAAVNGSKEALAAVKKWNRRTGSRQKLSDEDFYAEPGSERNGFEYYYTLERHGRFKREYADRTHLGPLWETCAKLDPSETEALAMAGDAEKQYCLAWMYDWGLGVKQDMEKAIYWFTEAAFNRYAPAQTELGVMYHYGIVATTLWLEVFGRKNYS